MSAFDGLCDHVNGNDANEMEAKEISILSDLGYPNPYLGKEQERYMNQTDNVPRTWIPAPGSTVWQALSLVRLKINSGVNRRTA